MKKIGFTLAEVLITLTIIGVIAAITIPNLMQKWSDHADVVKVKEAYSILGNAIKMAVVERGEIRDWDWPKRQDMDPDENGTYCASVLTHYLKVAKDCTNNTKGECSRFQLKNLQGEDLPGGSGMHNYWQNVLILQNGMSVECTPSVIVSEPINNIVPALVLTVDINGAKAPNRDGWDRFVYFYKSTGNALIDSFYKFDSRHCNPLVPYSIADSNNGRGCVKWIINHGNMDYKYRDVSAEW